MKIFFIRDRYRDGYSGSWHIAIGNFSIFWWYPNPGHEGSLEIIWGKRNLLSLKVKVLEA